MRLDAKVALITGGGRGIGKEIARRFAGAGAQVVLASRKEENLRAAAEEIGREGGKAYARPCHVGRLPELEDVTRWIEAELGGTDILVNNSATNVGHGAALDLTDEALLKTFEINVLAAQRLVRLAVPGMIRRGWGRVINIASIAGVRPLPEGSAYSASKAALLMMTRSWAAEFGRHGVLVNAISPGWVRTEFSASFWSREDFLQELAHQQPIPRIAETAEIGGIALYLASDEASYVNGQNFIVDGGLTAV